jgi:hypothetical protein
MNRRTSSWLLLLVLAGCGPKDPEEDKTYFSVVDFARGQVKKVDSSGVRITRILTEDGRSDTALIGKPEFRSYASEFTSLPDISTGSRKRHYEESNSYDDLMNNVLLSYTTSDPDEEVRRQTLMLEPDENGNTHMRTVLVNHIRAAGDSTVEKDLTWHVDRRFQVVTKVRRKDQPEKISVLVVKWE